MIHANCKNALLQQTASEDSLQKLQQMEFKAMSTPTSDIYWPFAVQQV